MILERILKPRYIALILEEIPREKGLHIMELPKGTGYEVEVGVEYFVDSTFGKFIYIVKSKDLLILARSDKKLNVKEKEEFLIRNEKGLKRFLISKVSKSEKIKIEGLSLSLAMVAGILFSYFTELEDYMVIIAGIFGVAGKIIEKVFMYYIIGYCKS
ncbi:hypothetical protein [Pyrococcus abyssi]|uniref:Uncharacterized protein n=1 Tax=Pyrococcus abyssi (strain GE5 / Orsay) TaxID=272844 RepID=Q9V1Q8_PYRAB|nr:hypothetical protein [Pyrococcus abyssi]CAB49291.1 Hypothetical protein PAB0246 [Pyrococcus abyssi GE5]CCE69746.1 TPA: hypothetical protein PAB0246 [Pyrococcus abyssi GE5]